MLRASWGMTVSSMPTAHSKTSGVATTLDDALHVIARVRPDVVVCDVMLGDAPAGLGVAQRLRANLDAPPPVLLLSSYGARYFQRTALANGAAGYVLKSSTASPPPTGYRSVLFLPRIALPSST